METYSDAPQVLRNFLSYHETVKGQSRRTVSEYYLDLRMFLRFVRLMREELPYKTPLDDIPIKDLGLDFIRSITTSEVFDFLSYLANDRENPEAASGDAGIGSAARARKLSAIKAFYNYLTVSTKQITENPVKDIEFPKIRKSLPKYLSLDESKTLLKAVQGPNQARDFAKAIDRYLIERSQIVLSDNRALFGSRDGNRISVSAVHRLAKKHLLAAGLDSTQFSAHKLRHTAATLMLSNGVDLKTLQEVLGHENLNTTQIYTHIESTELKIAAEANPLSHLALDGPDTKPEK